MLAYHRNVPTFAGFPEHAPGSRNSSCHAESHAESDARKITFAPVSGACRGLWAYKTLQRIPCPDCEIFFGHQTVQRIHQAEGPETTSNTKKGCFLTFLLVGKD